VIFDAALQSCDGLDGVVDGLISNPAMRRAVRPARPRSTARDPCCPRREQRRLLTPR
jgi:hypothetical protein